MKSDTLRPLERFHVTPVHGEARTVFHVVDSQAPEESQPAILATFGEREQAQRLADARNTPPALRRFRQARAQRRRSAWAQHGHALARAFQHLAGAPGLTLGGAFVLSIGRARYVAIRYAQRTPILPGCPAYARGERVSEAQGLYVLGELPPSYVHNPGGLYTNGLRYTFEVADDAPAAGALGGTWYVAGYTSEESQRLSAERGEAFTGPAFYLRREELPPIGEARTFNGRGDTL